MSLFDRLSLVVGIDNIEKLKRNNVVIIGLGGVGGSCFETLIRSGIENITICDFDTFDESNLNRQILSNISNIGKLKIDAAYDFAININPNCNIVKYNLKLEKYVNDIDDDNNELLIFKKELYEDFKFNFLRFYFLVLIYLLF